ncbi:hypothetical protein KSP39_PZI009360 [Platanthera zijinensis]|uniref:Uncharacterized protein n=1 Tax=Platanthera zijinensis TaxID=2320716 RepID=A0AAP0G7M2_9ASPA
MRIVKKKHLEPCWSVAGDKGFAGEPKSPGFTTDFEDRKRKSEGSDGFISIDIASLSLIVASSASSPSSAAGEEDRIVGDRVLVPFKKPLSKKGSQRDGERAELRPVAAGKERAGVVILHKGNEDSGTFLTLKTPTTTTGASNGSRCLAGRRHSWWLHPRRVLVFFASL